MALFCALKVFSNSAVGWGWRGAAVLSDTLSPPVLITAALKHAQPSVSAALLRAEAALCVSVTPVLHPQHPPLSAGGGSQNRFLWRLTWSGASAVPTGGSLGSSSGDEGGPAVAGSPGAAGMPRRGVPAGPPMLRSPPTRQVATEAATEKEVPHACFQSKGVKRDTDTVASR